MASSSGFDSLHVLLHERPFKLTEKEKSFEGAQDDFSTIILAILDQRPERLKESFGPDDLRKLESRIKLLNDNPHMSALNREGLQECLRTVQTALAAGSVAAAHIGGGAGVAGVGGLNPKDREMRARENIANLLNQKGPGSIRAHVPGLLIHPVLKGHELGFLMPEGYRGSSVIVENKASMFFSDKTSDEGRRPGTYIYFTINQGGDVTNVEFHRGLEPEIHYSLRMLTK